MCVFGGDGGKGDGRGLWRVASSTSLLTAVGTHWGPIATRGTLISTSGDSTSTSTCSDDETNGR